MKRAVPKTETTDTSYGTVPIPETADTPETTETADTPETAETAETAGGQRRIKAVPLSRTDPTYEAAGALIGAVTGLSVGGVTSGLSISYMKWDLDGFPGYGVVMVTAGLFGLVGTLIGADLGRRIPRRNTRMNS
jgi:hypothetical protein